MPLIIEAALLALSCSLDAFMAGFAYGSKKISIPFLSGLIICLICSGVLSASLAAGAAVGHALPLWLTKLVCCAALALIGIAKLLDSVTKSIIRRYTEKYSRSLSREYSLSLLNFRLILTLYANPEVADADRNKIISPHEAAALALALSLDGLGVGFGAGLGSVSVAAAAFASLAAGLGAIFLGSLLGGRLSRSAPRDISWLSGVILLVMAAIRAVR